MGPCDYGISPAAGATAPSGSPHQWSESRGILPAPCSAPSVELAYTCSTTFRRTTEVWSLPDRFLQPSTTAPKARVPLSREAVAQRLGLSGLARRHGVMCRERAG